MLVTVDGIVIGRRPIGETSFFLDVLTDEYGVIEVTAHGIKKLNNKNAGACALFSYSKFCFAKTGTRYTLNSAEPKFSFPGVSYDIDYFSLAMYFAEVLKDTVQAEQEAAGFLRFMAITLFEIDKKRVALDLIKAVFELHISALLGFAPDLRACSVCVKYEHEKMYFDLDESRLVCSDCIDEYGKDKSELWELSPQFLYALRYIVYSPVDRIYKLEPPQKNDLYRLYELAEKYLLKQLDRDFRSLFYYKKVRH